MQERPVVLVTGCSSGIGRAAVGHLERAGFHVVATARKPADIEALASQHVDTLALDVTDDGSRRAAIDATMKRHGRLDALVNNAGFGAVAAAEETTPDLLQRLFETNLFGAHELCRLALPIMRDKEGGRIVNVSSLAGHLPIPMQSAYCATKFAMRAMTMTMDIETRDFGVRCVLVEPGFVNTGFGQRSTQETEATVADRETGPYAQFHARWSRRRSGNHGASPDVLAATIVRACTDKRPKIHYMAPFHAKAYNMAKRLLPDSLILWAAKRKFSS